MTVVKQISMKDRLLRKVHRGVEPGVRSDGQDDESIPHQGDCVTTREDSKEGFLHLGVGKRCPGG